MWILISVFTVLISILIFFAVTLEYIYIIYILFLNTNKIPDISIKFIIFTSIIWILISYNCQY
jgi:hypothetical protein